MGCTQELPTWIVDLVITSQEESFIWERTWYPVSGVGSIDFTTDVRNRVLGSGAAMAIKPSLQLAIVRTDRPDAGAAITAGSVIPAEGLTHFEETVSGSAKAFFRRGWSFKLTAGSYARCETLMHTSFRSCAKIFPVKEIEIEPNNGTAAYHFVSLSGVMAAHGVDSAKIMAILHDNLNNALEWRLAGRGFNDPNSRGAWVLLETGWRSTTAGDSSDNTGEVPVATPLSLTTNHFVELGLAWRKSTDGATNSRCLMQILFAVLYS